MKYSLLNLINGTSTSVVSVVYQLSTRTSDLLVSFTGTSDVLVLATSIGVLSFGEMLRTQILPLESV